MSYHTRVHISDRVVFCQYYIIDYAEDYPKCYLLRICLFTICSLSSYWGFFHFLYNNSEVTPFRLDYISSVRVGKFHFLYNNSKVTYPRWYQIYTSIRVGKFYFLYNNSEV